MERAQGRADRGRCVVGRAACSTGVPDPDADGRGRRCRSQRSSRPPRPFSRPTPARASATRRHGRRGGRPTHSRDLRALGDYRCDLATGAAIPARARRRRSRSAATARARVTCTSRRWPTPGYDGRPLVFVVGLEEGGVFPRPSRTPVLLDEERRAIGPLLPDVSRAPGRGGLRGRSRGWPPSARRPRSVCLSFSCRDTREFRETFPSWIVLQAFRLQQGDRDAHLRGPVKAARRAGVAGAGARRPRADRRGLVAGAARHGGGARRRSCARSRRSRAASAPRTRARRTTSRRSTGYVPEAGAACSTRAAPAVPRRPPRSRTRRSARSASSCAQGLGVRPIEEGRADA